MVNGRVWEIKAKVHCRLRGTKLCAEPVNLETKLFR